MDRVDPKHKDKPFHKEECQCLKCDLWRLQNDQISNFEFMLRQRAHYYGCNQFDDFSKLSTIDHN